MTRPTWTRGAAALLALACWAGAPASAQDLAARLQSCVACHGAGGNSTLPNFPSLAAQPRVFLESQLVMIRKGLREIPAMKGMLDGVSDADLTAMAKHFAALPLQPAPAAKNAALFAQGQKVAEATRCDSCPLPSYVGREQMPRLAGQREDYLLHSMRQFQNNQATGRDTIMAASLQGIADADLQAMAHFLAHTTAP